MKKLGIIVLAVLLLGSFAGCNLFNGLPKVTEEEAIEAYTISMYAMLAAGLGMMGGELPEGVDLTESGGFEFTDFDVSDEEWDYTTMSGTIGTDDDGNTVADLTFEGGPVVTLKYTIPEDDETFTIIANGTEFTYDATEE
jgi:hypothetical protein